MDRYKKNPLCFGALDIGGTKISIGIADESGRIIASEKIKTEKDPEAAMKTAAEYLKNMSELRSCKLEAVGVSCAGPVDTVTGKVNNPYTLPGWEEYPLTERLSELSGVAVKLENDANCALLGEVQLSGLRKNRVLMISIGTGRACSPRHKQDSVRKMLLLTFGLCGEPSLGDSPPQAGAGCGLQRFWRPH